MLLGPLLHASGDSVPAVVNALFERVVPLARHEVDDELRLDRDDHKLSTGRLRQRVREIIRKRFQAPKAPSFWRDTPVYLEGRDGRDFHLDLQVWVEGLTAPSLMGAVTSAWYTSKFHRDSYLNSSYRSLTEARLISPDAKAGMFVLRPFEDARFTPGQMREIDNEIDAMDWLLKKHAVEMHTFDNEDSLAEGVMSLA